MKSYRAIGIMSGSSLDGLDVVSVSFEFDTAWTFFIENTSTLPLGKWVSILPKLRDASSQELAQNDLLFGQFIGEKTKEFIQDHHIKEIDLIASHGHTIFHFPEKGITCQIGNGQEIAHQTQTPTLADLRSKDVSLGGNGAPIVPIGDIHLFHDYEFCLNIGGIANISAKIGNKIIAFDICAANQILNYLALQKGKPYDDKGTWAKEGTVNKGLLQALNQLNFYKQTYPKSLDNGFSNEAIEIIEQYSIDIEDKLATYCQHIALQISNSIAQISRKENHQFATSKILITGGGAFNEYLTKTIQDKISSEVVIPSKEIIEFKEALIMAFMGVLYLRNENNCLSSVTGASQDCKGGILFKPK